MYFDIVTRTEQSLETRVVSPRLYCNIAFREMLVPSLLLKLNTPEYRREMEDHLKN